VLIPFRTWSGDDRELHANKGKILKLDVANSLGLLHLRPPPGNGWKVGTDESTTAYHSKKPPLDSNRWRSLPTLANSLGAFFVGWLGAAAGWTIGVCLKTIGRRGVVGPWPEVNEKISPRKISNALIEE
jgi:hypothetical protein